MCGREVDDLFSVVKFVSECLNEVYNAAAGPPWDGEASDQSGMAGRLSEM